MADSKPEYKMVLHIIYTFHSFHMHLGIYIYIYYKSFVQISENSARHHHYRVNSVVRDDKMLQAYNNRHRETLTEIVINVML